jgi:hypothetical protein
MRMDIVWIRRLLLLFMYLFLFLRPVLSSTQWLLLLVVLLPVSVVSRARRPWETPLASLTAFSEQKKNGRAADSNSFILARLFSSFDGGRACQNTCQPAGFSPKEMNGNGQKRRKGTSFNKRRHIDDQGGGDVDA